jgi:hypothetical protein
MNVEDEDVLFRRDEGDERPLKVKVLIGTLERSADSTI